MVYPADTLAVMLDTLESCDYEALLTTICHHAAKPTVDDVTAPNSVYSIFKRSFDADDYGFPDVETVWRDPRVEQEAVSTNPFMWEANVAMARTDVIRRAGMFDEDFDTGVGADNVALAASVMATTPGAKVVVVPITCFSLNHYVMQPDQPDRKAAEARNQRLLRRVLREKGYQMAGA